jgi:hypothetical protein
MVFGRLNAVSLKQYTERQVQLLLSNEPRVQNHSTAHWSGPVGGHKLTSRRRRRVLTIQISHRECMYTATTRHAYQHGLWRYGLWKATSVGHGPDTCVHLTLHLRTTAQSR